MPGKLTTYDLHATIDRRYIGDVLVTYRPDTQFNYTFENFFHPLIGELIEQLNKSSVSGLLDAKHHEALASEFFDAFYRVPSFKEGEELVTVLSFRREIDLIAGGPYANYNWELLFHLPLTIAVHLSKNQRFAEAQRWFHYIFDPTSNDTTLPPPRRYWKFLAFRAANDATQIDELLALLSKSEPSGEEIAMRDAVLAGYRAMQNRPFQPHAVANTRHIAYQYYVVMKYLDNLIAWGDSLFRQDTVESINEATQRYVLAANILGTRPQQIPPAGAARHKSFHQLRQEGLDPLGNALVELESKFPFNLMTAQPSPEGGGGAEPLFGLGRTLYFCIPRNDKMLGYWDTVADRLFKIRNCLNIEGVFRQLALFDPPLDPGMLVKAAASGINVASIVSGLNQPVGPVRALFSIQKAIELAGEVRAFGSTLLSALEKGDTERLALMRHAHELKLSELARDVRFLQWKQARESTETLLRSRAAALERYAYYLRLLGQKPDDGLAPEKLPLDRRELTEENFDEAYGELVGQYEKEIPRQSLAPLRLSESSVPALAGAAGPGKLFLNRTEDMELNRHLPAARDLRALSGTMASVAAILTFIPDLDAKLAFWGMGAGSRIFGGAKMSDAVKILSGIVSTVATWEQDQAGIASRTAAYERRADEWMFQSNLAARELTQIGRQIIGSLIAEQIAHHEYLNIQKQVESAKEIGEFFEAKFTSEALYAWMQSEVSRLYYEYYRFAFDTARRAERAMKFELMRPELDGADFIKFNYWDGGRKGLLAGEALHLDVKRLEAAYHENNRREYERTKHISLRQIDPLALLALKTAGSCEFAIPEWLFDIDGPGHYLRRLKSVSLSIPAVTGPYTSVSCTMTLLRSSVRKSPAVNGGDYVRQGSDDPRFIDYFGSPQSVVTSNGSNDPGMFEMNLRDDRFLPFEGAGAESTWRLQLPAAFRQFDYKTISDVVLHFRYTAREGGDELRKKAVEDLASRLADANSEGLSILFSMKHDFPDEWHRFAKGNGDLVVKIRRDYFPYFTTGFDVAVSAIDLHAIDGTTLTSATPAGFDRQQLSSALNDDGEMVLTLPPSGVLPRDERRQVFLVVQYGLTEP